MPGFSSYDDYLNERTVNGKIESWEFTKAGTAPEAAGIWHSFWKVAGSPGAGANAAATPGTVYAADATLTAGVMSFPDRDTDQKWLTSFEATATQNCTLMLYDRLVGVNITLASASQTLNTSAITRYTGTAGVNNQAWLEMTTASTGAGANIGVSSYTSADGSTGVAGIQTLALPAAAFNVDAMMYLPLSAAEQGITAAATLAVGTTATAGVANFLIIRPLARIGLLANVSNRIDFFSTSAGPVRIFDNAALCLAMLASSTTAVNVFGNIDITYG